MKPTREALRAAEDDPDPPPLPEDCLTNTNRVSMGLLMEMVLEELRAVGVEVSVPPEKLRVAARTVMNRATELKCCWRTSKGGYYQWDPINRRWLETECEEGASLRAARGETDTRPAPPPAQFSVFNDEESSGGGCGCED
ncbi:MAG TPA: hypothetical protein VD963_02155 [Phycisphaerales bacterium]|nr:hypothetical protein [Phycisphaerales bacterium]